MLRVVTGLSLAVALGMFAHISLRNIHQKLLFNLCVSVLMVNPSYIGRVAFQLPPADELSLVPIRSGGFVPQIY